MTLTRARTIQYVGILFSLMLIAAGYWYWSARAGVKSNTAASQPQGVGNLDSGLAGYWKFDETSGTSAADASTNSNNATLAGATQSWVSGQIGGALDFNGLDDIATVTYSASLTSATALSYAFWIKPDLNDGNGFLGALNGEDGSSYNFIRIDNSGTEAGNPTVAIVRTINATLATRSVQFAYPVSTWFHGVYTYDGVYERLYINGKELGEWAQTGNFATNTEYGLVFGKKSSSIGTEYDGALDEVRFYSRALSVDEVAQLYTLATPTSVDTSLKGYWSFNSQDISGTTAYDRSGAGNTGTLTNGPTVAQGIAGQALSFDGSDDYITVADSVALSPATTMTVSVWVNIAVPITLNSRAFFSKGASGDRSWAFISTETGRIRFYVSSDANDAGANFGETVSTSLSQGEWAQVTAVFDGALSGNENRLKIYVNGVQQSMTYTGTIAATLVDSAASLKLGETIYSSGSMNGYLDEARLYNRAFSTSEIKSLYDITKPDATNTASSQAQGTGRLDSGLLGYWPLDNGSGTSATDLSTNGNTGTLTNGPTWTTGQIGGAVQFDGTDDRISLSTSTALDLDSAHSISAWVKTSASNTNQHIFTSGTAGCCGTEAALTLTYNSGGGTYRFRFEHTSVGRAESSYEVQTNTWYHVVGTWDGNSAQRIYVNGVLNDTHALAALSGSEYSNGAAIGADELGNTRWNGSIDEVRVYNWALADEDVAELYRLTTPTAVDSSLKGYWSFNGPDMNGVTAYDRSGAGNTGTLTNGPVKTIGVVGQALTFDGTNDYVIATNSVDLNSATGFTTTAWFKTTSSADTKIFSNNASAHPLQVLTGKLRVCFSTCTLGTTAINDGRWHFAATIATGGVLRAYIDGASVPEITHSYSGTYSGVPSIGMSGYSYYFPGSIDEVRLYNRDLSVSEVRNLYDASAPDKGNSSASQPQGTGRLDSGLSGYWKMDENTGTTVGDSSTNANTGSRTCDGGLCANPAWTTGQIGSGLDFNGTSNYVNIPDAASLRPENQSYTVAAWAKPDNINQIGPVVTKRQNGGSSEQFYMTICSGSTCGSSGKKLYFSMIESGGGNYRLVVSANDVADGNWHHLVAVANQRTNTVDVYVDGVLASGTKTSNGSWPTVNNTDPLRIGSDNGSLYYNGAVDEVRTYSRALSEEEIVQLYRLGTPTGTDTSLKGYWSFNGQDISGTTAYDRSGAGNNGTLTNGPTKTIGKLGQALSFDGTDDYVTMGDLSIVDGASALTLSAWFKRSAASAQLTVGKVTNDLQRFDITMWTDGNVYLNNGDGTAPAYGYFVSNDTNWHHIVYVYDGSLSGNSNRTKAYVDGVAQSLTFSGTIPVTTQSTADPFVFGRNLSTGTYSLGNIDEVRLYNRAFTAAEAISLYNQSK
jgi:hypothetical protein